MGINSLASGTNSTAIGSGNKPGEGAKATGNSAAAIGSGAQATGDNSAAIGKGAEATNENAAAVGGGAKAAGKMLQPSVVAQLLTKKMQLQLVKVPSLWLKVV